MFDFAFIHEKNKHPWNVAESVFFSLHIYSRGTYESRTHSLQNAMVFSGGRCESHLDNFPPLQCYVSHYCVVSNNHIVYATRHESARFINSKTALQPASTRLTTCSPSANWCISNPLRHIYKYYAYQILSIAKEHALSVSKPNRLLRDLIGLTLTRDPYAGAGHYYYYF